MITPKKAALWFTYVIGIIFLLVVIALLAIRFVVFPNIDHYKQWIADKASVALAQKVNIGDITPGWVGILPKVTLQHVVIFDKENKPALTLNEVNATLSWLSVPKMHLYLSELSLNAPELLIQRKADGQLFLAGIPLHSEQKSEFPNWLLSQAKIEIKQAQITWQDDLRHAPPLKLKQLNATLDYPAWRSLLGQHQLKISALADVGSKQPIVIAGDFTGRDVHQMQDWHGAFSIHVKQMDLAVWKPWLDYPINLERGQGNADIKLAFAEAKIHQVQADLKLDDLAAKKEASAETFKAAHLSGQLAWEKDQDSATWSAENLRLDAGEQFKIDGGAGHVTFSRKDNKPWQSGEIKLDHFNLIFVKTIPTVIKLPTTIAAHIAALAPSGELSAFSFNWEGSSPIQNPAQNQNQAQLLFSYTLTTNFNHLTINAYEKIPGVQNLSGAVKADETSGELILNSADASIDLKGILRWPIPASQLKGEVDWKIQAQKINQIAVSNLFITSPHITGTVNGSLDLQAEKGGLLDLTGDFSQGNAEFARFYYPIILGEHTLSWLDSSILSGKADDVRVIVKGHLHDFPFVNAQHKPDPNLGEFSVKAKITEADLEFGEHWPIIENISLDMLFEGKRMELNANKGHIFGVNILKSKVVIPQLDAESPMLNIDSEAAGPIADGLKFVNKSPVKEVTLGFTDQLKVAGNGHLKLALALPLHDIEAAKFQGVYTINDGTIYSDALAGLPQMDAINGSLNFDEHGLNAQNISGKIFGDPVDVSINTSADKSVHIIASGTVTSAGIKQMANNPLTDLVQGSSRWSGEIDIKKPLMTASFKSDLVGMGVDLPAPFGKTAAQAASLLVTKTQASSTEDVIDVNYNQLVNAKLARRDINNMLVFDRGDIGVNLPAKLGADSGLTLHGTLDMFKVDDWLNVFKLAKSANDTTQSPIKRAELSVNRLEAFNRNLNNLKLIAEPQVNGVKLTIDSDQITGKAEWLNANSANGDGKITAQLKKLIIPNNTDAKTADLEPENAVKRLESKYPALDIQAEQFQLGNKNLGALDLNAYPNQADWVIQKLKISNSDSTLEANGTWHNWTHNPNTNLIFNFSTQDIGNALKSFGQPDVVKGGTASVSGQLRWPGSPHEFKTNGLSGDFKLEAAKGQVVKVQPGVGRLLGLLSLQSLPRRLTLDFRDLFSEGFAFDKINATAKIDNGIMRSDDFFMTGPAAEAEIKGETDLQKETQNLKVKVIPHVSDSLSLAALAGGPIVGAAAFVAQKILKDPLNKIGQTDYVIAGTWDNPIEVGASKENKPKEKTQSPLNQQ